MRSFQTLLFSLFVSFLVVPLSCRKADMSTGAKSTMALEEQFFNSNRSADPTEAAIVAYLKRENSKHPFVAEAMKKIGFPRWNKLLTRSQKGLKREGRVTRQGTTDSTTTVYIPFVRDSQNRVNASIAVRMGASDTTFTYLMDWQ